jgi:nitric oxide reductase subunit C
MLRIWIGLFSVFMIYTLFVYTGSDKGNKEGAPAEAVRAGWKIWQDKNCQSCHQLYGLGGYMGPDLTNAASLKDENYMRTYLKYGTGKMPDYALTDSNINDLVVFLKWIDKSGHALVPKENVTLTGNYELGN